MNIKIRDSRIESLRIVTAILILAHHAIQHGGESYNSLIQAPFSINQIWGTVIGSWGQLGVTIFLIISSWFLTEIRGGYGVRVSKALNLGLLSWGYGIVIMIALILLGYSIPVSTVIKTLITPLYPYNYWFVTTYIAFFLTVPILKIVLNNLTDRGLLYTITTGSLLVPVYNILFENVYGSLLYFYYIFFLVGYLKKHDNNWFIRHRYLVFMLSSLLVIVIISAGSLISTFWGGELLLGQLKRIHDTRNIITVVQGISLFYIFYCMKPFKSPVINLIAKTSFSIYLISESIVLRGDIGKSILWNKIFHFSKMYDSGLIFIPYSFIAILIVYVFAVAVDIIRQIISQKVNIRIKLIQEIDKKSMECFNDRRET